MGGGGEEGEEGVEVKARPVHPAGHRHPGEGRRKFWNIPQGERANPVGEAGAETPSPHGAPGHTERASGLRSKVRVRSRARLRGWRGSRAWVRILFGNRGYTRGRTPGVQVCKGTTSKGI